MLNKYCSTLKTMRNFEKKKNTQCNTKRSKTNKNLDSDYRKFLVFDLSCLYS